MTASTLNYYGKLGLPVERFESNVEKLRTIAEEKIREWNSCSAGTTEYTFAQVHGEKIRASIENNTLWRSIYEQYKAEVDKGIETGLILKTDSQNTISKENFFAITQEYHVSEDYAGRIAQKCGITVNDDYKKNPKIKPKLNSIKPNDRMLRMLKGVLKSLEALSFETVPDFINDELGDTRDSLTTSQEMIIDHLRQVYAKYKPIMSNTDAGQKKSTIERIYTGMRTFFKYYSMKDYAIVVKWNRLNAVFRELEIRKVSELNQRGFDMFTALAFEAWGNRDEAQALLEDYCTENNIGYPRVLAQEAVCPYCNTRFERKQPIQTKCPSCGESFLITCPKCGKSKHIIEDGSCDGIILTRYPFLKKRLDLARKNLDQLSIERAGSILDEIEDEWPDFPGSCQLRERCRSETEKYGKAFDTIKRLCAEKQYCEAKRQRDRIAREYPQVTDLFGEIDDRLSDAQRLWTLYEREQREDKKRRLLLQASEIVSDDNRIIAALSASASSISAVQNLKCSISAETGAVLLSWESDNQPGSVIYRIRRKEGSIVSNAGDGEEVGYTSDLSFSDSAVPEAKLFFYAVYASVGPLMSVLCASQEPVVFLKQMEAHIATHNDSISGTWPMLPTGVQALVRYASKPISGLSDGEVCSNVTLSGFTIEHLPYGRPCHFAIWKIIQHQGKSCYSHAQLGCITPMELVSFPEVAKTLGTRAGEYIFTLKKPKAKLQLSFYGTQGRERVTSNTHIPLSQLQAQLQPIVSSPCGKNQYSVSMLSKEKMTIYPVYIQDGMAAIGRYHVLQYVDSVSVVNHVVSDNKLVLYLDSWPSSLSLVQPCYSSDQFPELKSDAEVRLDPLGRIEGRKTIGIPLTGNKQYYITVFAHVDGSWVSVCNYYFDYRAPHRITYSFKKKLFGKLLILLNNETSERPALHLRVKRMAVPLSISEGEEILSIPANDDAPEIEIIEVPVKLNKKMYGKLFSDDKMFMMVQLDSGLL